jgi:hypothetical protein
MHIEDKEENFGIEATTSENKEDHPRSRARFGVTCTRMEK